MSNHYDLIIIGAGAAGLSFLLALNKQNYQGKVLVLEAEASFYVNKTWGFWLQDEMPDYINHLIKHRWSCWQLTHQERAVLHTCADQAYCSVDAKDFFEYASNVISDNHKFNLQFNAQVISLCQEGDIAKVNTQINHFTANAVVDTRAVINNPPQNALYQCFYGLEVTTNSDCFNDKKALLMHEIKHGPLGTEFLYVLPYSSTHAIIEYTCFSSQVANMSELKHKAQASLDKLIGNKEYQLIRHEQGTLPMFNIERNLMEGNSVIIKAGIAGGAMRASTGYCFMPIQRWAQALSKEFCESQKLRVIHPIPALYRFLDNIFLRVMTENKTMGPSILFMFATGMGGPAFARFMSEKANILDLLKVIMVMPKVIFIKGFFRYLLQSKSPEKR